MEFLGIGTMELIFIFLVALLVLGPNRMLEVARALGKYVREFQRAASEVPRLLSMDEEPPPPPLPPRQSVSDEGTAQPDGEEEDTPPQT
jgi:sec-independent protein translocase protein TatB